MKKAAKIKKVKAAVEKHKAKLKYYQELFMADGEIDSKEQKKLDKFFKIIEKCEAKLRAMEEGINKQTLEAPNPAGMTASTDTVPNLSDAGEVEMAFCQAIQSWCNSLRHAISEFEKQIDSGVEINADSSFLVGIVRSVMSELTGKHSLLFDIGMDFFDKLVADLESQAKANKITLRQLSHTWDERISTLYRNIPKQRAMYRDFKKSRAGLTDDQLREEIIKWPMGGAKGLPTEKHVKGSIMSIWMRGLEDKDWVNVPFFSRNNDGSEHPDIQAGYITLDVYGHRSGENLRTGDPKFTPTIKKITIDDLKNQKALDAFKQLWRGKNIADTPLNIRMIVTLESPDPMVWNISE